jgi:hypothetical protein
VVVVFPPKIMYGCAPCLVVTGDYEERAPTRPVICYSRPMRFHAAGPAIPHELLEARDNGEVVFFCGAGVSIPAGLPSFAGLAQQLVSDLGVPADAPSRRLLDRALTEKEPDFTPSIDLILDILQREYGAAQVEDAVNRKLRTPKNANLSHHQSILALSTNSEGKARCITTNFDLLFERAAPKLKWYAPPSLPDLSQEHEFEGVVYLHGRMTRRSLPAALAQRLILGEGDFGRAYLADGWASQFLRELLARYTIVLLGYSADDPPIRYLLKGLHSRAPLRSQQIYAFAEGPPGQVNARWADRGVKAIAYQKSSSHHSELWDTLEAWAQRARNPVAWRDGVTELARRKPATVSAHERGQVAALVRSAAGAKAFADAQPLPLADWLCVFDAVLRYAEPRRDANGAAETSFDPLQNYGLDDDLPRAPSNDRNKAPQGVDLLSPITTEERAPSYIRLGGPLASRAEPLSARLDHISRWISNLANQPATVWWAAGYPALHHRLRDLIEFTITKDGYSTSNLITKAWRLLFEVYQRQTAPLRFDWHNLQRSLRRDGWTSTHLRTFAEVIRPQLKVIRPRFGDPRPPEIPEDKLRLADLARFELEFVHKVDETFVIPDAKLPNVVSAMRAALEHAASILADIEDQWWQTPTLHPEDKPGQTFIDDNGAFFLWFARSFEALLTKHPAAARREFLGWPEHEPFFFDKLRVWAWMKPDVAPPSDVAKGLLGVSLDEFWPRHHEREFLWTLRARWKNLSREERRRIERRIILGPGPFPDERKTDYMRRKSLRAAVRLGWLKLNGCALSGAARQRLLKLRKADSRWQPSFDKTADESHEGRSGWVRTEADPAQIAQAPISKIIDLARRYSAREFGTFVELKPFQGLVQSRPARALAALSYEARHGRFPPEFWEQLISHWPNTASSRANWLLANRLAHLPKDLLITLRFYVPRWLRERLPDIAQQGSRKIWPVWDAIFESLVTGDSDSTTSSLGDVTVGGVPQARSRRTYTHSLNSPIGSMTDCLMRILEKSNPGRGSGLPDLLRERMERALAAPGEGGDHAVVELCLRLRWLHWLDSNWTEKNLIPLFELDHPTAEAAWNGLAHDNELPAPETFQHIKQSFLETFRKKVAWRWEEDVARRLSQFLVVAALWHGKSHPYISFAEARAALQSASDETRVAALWQLNQFVQGERGWKKAGKKFLEKAWPKEAKYQTGDTSKQLADIAIKAGDDFPEAVATILPLLTSAEHIEMFVYYATGAEKKDQEPLAKRFPKQTIEVLNRLVAAEPQSLPYDLAAVLNMTAEAQATLRQDLQWRRLNDLLAGP